MKNLDSGQHGDGGPASAAGADGTSAGVRAAMSAAAGCPTAVLTVALANAGRTGAATAVAALGTVAVIAAAVLTGAVGQTLALGHAQRRLLRAATAEARRTDKAAASTAVALINALGSAPGPNDHQPTPPRNALPGGDPGG